MYAWQIGMFLGCLYLTSGGFPLRVAFGLTSVCWSWITLPWLAQRRGQTQLDAATSLVSTALSQFEMYRRGDNLQANLCRLSE